MNCCKTRISKIVHGAICALLFTILAISCAKDIVDLNGSVQGVIKDFDTGALISNCQVSLSPSGKSALTGSDGVFVFSNLEPGSYNLSFLKAGYDDATKTMTVVSGETSSVNITLKAKSAFAASSSKLDFGDMSSSMELYFYNNSDEATSFSISNIPAWASFSQTSGSVSASGNKPLTVTVSRDAVDYGTHTQIVSVDYKGKTSGTLSLTIQMQKVKLSAPAVTINVAAEDITQDGFTIQGELTATGGAVVTSYGHCWSLSRNPTIDNTKTDLGSTKDLCTYKSKVTELSPGTTYYVRAYATNQYGTGYSEQIAVTTQDVASNKWDGEIAQSFAGGSGTSVDPYIIQTGGQLLLMKDYNNKYFELANNIDLDNKNWMPFEFKGTLNGKGCIISNLKVVHDTEGQGLFSTISNGNVQNLTIKNVNINVPTQSLIGALAGLVNNKEGAISNCHVVLTEKSQITGNSKVGGLIGSLSAGSVSDCSVEYSGTSSDAIKGNNDVGGLVGAAGNYSSTIYSCKVFSNVKGVENVGGVVGATSGSSAISIEQCVYKGIISGEKNICGIVGYSESGTVVIASKADVELTASSGFGGGIVGSAYISGYSKKGIIACYATGTIKSNSSEKSFGGLYGGSGGNTYFYSVLSYSTVTSASAGFDGISGMRDERPQMSQERSESCASVAPTRFTDTNKGGCKNITAFLKDCHLSEYDKYWSYQNTWTWAGAIGGEPVDVSCPRLSWE